MISATAAWVRRSAASRTWSSASAWTSLRALWSSWRLGPRMQRVDSRHRLERDHGRDSSRRVGTRERLSTSTVGTAPWSCKRCPWAKVRRWDNELRSPANAGDHLSRARGAAAAGECRRQNVCPRERNGRLGKARPAFVGCNGKLCHGRNGGDSWDSGLGSAKPGLADSELGVGEGLFEGGEVGAAVGAADAARISHPRLKARSRSRLVETRGSARVTYSVNRGRHAVVLEALPLGQSSTVG